jgi:hypothetical protein
MEIYLFPTCPRQGDEMSKCTFCKVASGNTKNADGVRAGTTQTRLSTKSGELHLRIFRVVPQFMRLLGWTMAQ